ACCFVLIGNVTRGNKGHRNRVIVAPMATASPPSVSLCIPARDEEATIGHIVGTVRRDLVERVGLVDEIIVIDDGSLDDTAAAARDEGAPVIAESSILATEPAGSGKGNVLWKSLHASRGDIVCWVDAD